MGPFLLLAASFKRPNFHICPANAPTYGFGGARYWAKR